MLSHRVSILNDGEVVETGLTEQIFGSPRHPYTARLIASLPRQPAMRPYPPDSSSVGDALMNQTQTADNSRVKP